MASADSVAGLAGVWVSNPKCEDGEYVVEIFNDGTALLILQKDGVAQHAVYLTVKATDNRGSFLLENEHVPSFACFDVKENRLAVLRFMQSTKPIGAVRMEQKSEAP